MSGYLALEKKLGSLNWRTCFKSDDIKRYLDSDKWEFGSENIDDDFHTDIIFLREACHGIYEIIQDKHERVLLKYNGYHGEFFFERDSTERICSRIINLLVSDKDFRKDFNERVIRSSDALWNIFDNQETYNFKLLDNDSILRLYTLQLESQKELYKDCWISEVLQSPCFGIEKFLREYLRNLRYSDDEIEVIMYNNFKSNKNSVYMEEIQELELICDIILSDKELLEKFKLPLKYLRTHIPYNIKLKLYKLSEKYGYLAYHGFGDRRKSSVDDYLLRIQQLLFQSMNRGIKEKAVDPLKITSELFSKIKYPYTEIFKLWSEMAITKAYRRLAQLKNFYFLDKLIESISYNNKIPESIIRFMTPEEVIALIGGDKSNINIEEIKLRSIRMVYSIRGDKELLSTNLEYVGINPLQYRLAKEINSNILHGQVACHGYCKGRAVLIERLDDVDFQSGDIIVALEGDPDLIPLIKKAGGIVTDQGGVTCHIAVIARELNIPCIIGTSVATKLISTGDTLFIDAYTGNVEIIS